LARFTTWKLLGGGALMAWCLLSAGAALRDAISHTPDPMDEQQALFLPLVPELPPHGEIGYLEPYHAGTEADVRLHYAAQYALTPRVVVAHTGPDWLIVPPGAEDPAGDARLAGYRRVRTFANGIRLFRRFPA
jgi:hypothetical protein